MTYILVDTLNLFHRAKHSVRGDSSQKIGMAFHIIFSSVLKSWRDFGGSHVVFCLEGRSWRKDYYTPYKRNRQVAREALTESEREEEATMYEALDTFVEFVNSKTNCTVLQHSLCEADDFIARWTQNHPNDNHVIVSSDSDFYQLLSPTVSQYNGMVGHHITINGVFDEKGKQVIDKKTKEPKVVGDPKWLLFEKCIRGDSSDNVFSAYPGVRKKGTKNKVGMLDAFADMEDKGVNWNNFMLQSWSDHEGNEHRVIDDYNRNKTLIDLTQQPSHIKNILDETIVENVQKEPVSQVGIHFLRFCGMWDLIRLSENAGAHAEYLSALYQ
jgi:5'-3' exonuclease